MTGLQDGDYHVRLRTEGGRSVCVWEPMPITREDLATLRREHALMKAQVGLHALEQVSAKFRAGLRLTKDQALILAYLFLNASRPVSLLELRKLVYGKRSVSTPEDPTAAVRCHIYALRKRKTPYGVLRPAVATVHGHGVQITQDGIDLCRKAVLDVAVTP
jgi:DNA-binding response OmpR family regulator